MAGRAREPTSTDVASIDPRIHEPELEQATVDAPITADTFPSLTSARFLTRHGVVDVVLRPDGVNRYEDWAARATTVVLSNGARVKVAALDDIIASKAAANRPKDQYALARLRALRDILSASEQAGDQ